MYGLKIKKFHPNRVMKLSVNLYNNYLVLVIVVIWCV